LSKAIEPTTTAAPASFAAAIPIEFLERRLGLDDDVGGPLDERLRLLLEGLLPRRRDVAVRPSGPKARCSARSRGRKRLPGDPTAARLISAVRSAPSPWRSA
jgi:hypothetical protein